MMIYTKKSTSEKGTVSTIILAGGKGKRMKSSLAKVLHPLGGVPMLNYPLDLAQEIGSERIILVIGHQAEKIKEIVRETKAIFVHQTPQLGTGHALLSARDAIKDLSGDLLILYGDTPLVREETITRLIKVHQKKGSLITLLTSMTDSPNGYGRIIRDGRRKIIRVVEEADTNQQEKRIREINSGIYCFDIEFLFGNLDKLERNNAQKEYYLTDLVKIATDKGIIPHSLLLSDPTEILGINSRADLAMAHEVLRKRIMNRLMDKGVTIIDPKSTYIEAQVTVGRDTIIYPFVQLRGKTFIGKGSIIEACVYIEDSILADAVTVKPSSVILGSIVDKGATIGPFSHIRPESEIGKDTRIGNFVEVKKSKIGKGSKVSHLSYIGDTFIGKEVNIGAGTITCNFDGKKKHLTIIEDRVFVGSNTALVAPVKIGTGSTIGAGSTITQDVPPYSLSVGRTKQINLKKKRK